MADEQCPFPAKDCERTFTALGNAKINRFKGSVKRFVAGDLSELILALTGDNIDTDIALLLAQRALKKLNQQCEPTEAYESLKKQ